MMCIINTKITFQEQQHQLEIRWETALRMWAWVQITWIFQRSIEGTNQPIIIYGWGLQSCILVWTEMQHWIQMLQEWWAPPFFLNLYRRLGRKNLDPCQVRDSLRLVSERQHTGVAGHVEIGWCALGSMASRQLLAYLGIWGWSPWSYA